METRSSLEAAYVPSENVVAREVDGELILVPLVAGLADAEVELFTLNDTGRAIWGRLNGRATLGDVVRDLAEEYDAPSAEIEKDVLGLAAELLRRGILVAAPGD